MVARAIGKLSVFIVYSPQDGPFVFRLVEALHRKGFTTIVDHDATLGEDPHQQPIELAAADVVVFVLSPDSATSESCRREVDQALRLKKRVLPVLCRPLDGVSPPPTLGRARVIVFAKGASGSAFDAGLAQLEALLNGERIRLLDRVRLDAGRDFQIRARDQASDRSAPQEAPNLELAADETKPGKVDEARFGRRSSVGAAAKPARARAPQSPPPPAAVTPPAPAAGADPAPGLAIPEGWPSRAKRSWRRSLLGWLGQNGDIVDCAVFAPCIAPPGQWISVQVFLHRPERLREAQQRATLIDATAAMAGISTLEVELARGTRVTIRLEVPAAQLQDDEQSLVWQGTTQGRSFLVKLSADADGSALTAKARFYVEGCPVGWISFVLRCGRSPEPMAFGPQGNRARRYSYAFISYASEDRREVKKRTQALRAARIRYFHDILSLDPGERWERRLYEEIDRCDLFMLFWSRAAGRSEWVEKEINRAIERRSASKENELPDIAPISLEPLSEAPPPPSLSGFHFDSSAG